MNSRLVQIGKVVEDISNWNPTKSTASDFKYVDLSSVDQSNKMIVNAVETSTAEAPSRARQLIRSGDVLVSTVRPNLNGVARVPPEFDGCTASTGFCVLRPKPKMLSSNYLFHWVQSAPFVQEMTRKATGASYPAVSDRIIKNSEIPLPPLDEQRRIAAILDKADALRQKRKQAIVLLNSLTQSIFLETFGDPTGNPKGFKKGTIGDLLAEVSYGTSTKAGDAGALPILRMGNITYEGNLEISDLKYIDLPPEQIDRYTVRKGDILFNRTNSADLVGKTAVFDLEQAYAFAGYLVRARAKSGVTPEYIAAYLNSRHGKAVLKNKAKSIVGMANINAKEMQSIPILVPPAELQRGYLHRLTAIRRAKLEMARALTAIDQLFSSLQHRAFSGEL